MTRRPQKLARLALAILLLAIGGAATAAAQGLGTGRVHGADALNVRRGPGAEHPSMGVLRRGDTVEIEAVVGRWALIRNKRFAGYVFAGFLARADGSPITAPTPTAVPAVGEAAVDAATTPGTLATATPTTAAASNIGPEVREDLSQILSLTKDIHREVQRRRDVPATPALAASPIGLQAGLGLLGLGGVIGFFIGSILGRQQERRGRPSVRL